MALFLHTARQGLARPTPSLGELRAMWTVESSRAPSLSFSAKSRSGATTRTPCISPTWRFTMRQAMTFSTLTMKLKLWKICPRYKEIPTILSPIWPINFFGNTSPIFDCLLIRAHGPSSDISCISGRSGNMIQG